MTTATEPPPKKEKHKFDPDEFRMTIGEHLEELRKRVVRYRLHCEVHAPDPTALGKVLQRNGGGAHWQAVIQDPDPDAVELLAPEFASAASDLGLPGEGALRYRPRSDATELDQLLAEFAERRSADVERGYSQHGPHLDEL